MQISGEEGHLKHYLATAVGEEGNSTVVRLSELGKRGLSRLSKSSDFAGRSPVLAEPLVRPLTISASSGKAFMTKGLRLGR